MRNIEKKDIIESLSPREHVRHRSGMYIGDTSSPNHLLLEIFANALDMHNAGYGNVIDVWIYSDGQCTVQDYAKGFPINEKREDGETTLQASFDVLNTSGKYTDDGLYEGVSLGLNGQGGKLVNFLCKTLEVRSSNGKEYEFIRFKDGIIESRETGKATDKISGTRVSYKPDSQFFDSIITDYNFFYNFFEEICCLCPNLTINLYSDDKEIKIQHPQGLIELLPKKIGNNIELINTPFSIKQKNKFDLVMSFTGSSHLNFTSYVNFGYTESGPHITAIKSCITRVLNNWAKEQGLLKEKEKNLEGSSIQEGMVLVCNLVSQGVCYDAQVKSRVTKINTSNFISTLGEELELWLDNNPDDGKIIIEKALLARKASEAARKARAAVKNRKAANNKPKILHPDKLKDAEYLGEGSTLLVVEGLSAGASMAVARDSKQYGILMLRGKLINCFTNKQERLEKNEEIQLLLQALNIIPGNYQASKLRYGKVAICTDSDSDGFHIGLLITTALQHFCPEFIQEERLCWLRSPLYIVKNKGKEQYYFTDDELNAAKEKGNVVGEVQRNKGLGSLSQEQAKKSMFGKNQHLDILKPNYNALILLEELMGSDTTKRKEYIFENIDFSKVRE